MSNRQPLNTKRITLEAELKGKGYSVIETGGQCTAYLKSVKEGDIMITTKGGTEIPTKRSQSMSIGLYKEWGTDSAFGYNDMRITTFLASDEQSIVNALKTQNGNGKETIEG